MSLGRPQPPKAELTLPTGDQIACYPTYAEAQTAVDFLADQQFGIEQLTIVGTDLRSVERVTGRLSYGRVALAGAMSGAWFGLFVGLLLSLFGGAGISRGIIFIAIALGAGFGLLFSVLSYALTRGKRDFTSQSQTVAGSYSIICSPSTSMAARQLLLNSPTGVGQTNVGAGISAPARSMPIVPVASSPMPGQLPNPGSGVVAQGAPGEAPISGADSQTVGQVVIIENPTVSAGPPAASAPVEAKEPDSRWTLPNGMPRYGALASEETVQALLANQSAATAPTPDPESGAVAQVVVPADPNQSA